MTCNPDRWSPSRWLDPEPTIVAYIAGIIDGEGSIGKLAGKHNRDQSRVSVGQLAETGLCPWLLEVTGVGGVHLENRVQQRRQMASWRVLRQAEVRDLLLAVRPFLIVKASAADEALARLNV